MKHKSKSIHIHVLMSGHNPEHEKKSNRGNNEGSHGHHKTKNAKPCDILMREHHYSGGISGAPQHYALGGRTSCTNLRFSTGGPLTADINRGTGVPRDKGGRMFAEGGHVDHESKGGRPRRRHADGGDIQEHVPGRLIGSRGMYRGGEQQALRKGGRCYAEGGETKEDYGEKPLTGQLRKGGRAMSRHHHYEGEPVADNSVREEKRKGGRAKRQHHYWGQNVIGRLPLVGGIANSIANTVGTLNPNQYGGAEYVARNKGQKAADILSTIGNLGANVALSKKSKGGGVHHKYRKHHAAGGAGKVRKDMID